jgi:hypothetical protein
MMMMRKRRKFLLSEKGSNQLLRSQLEVKEDPLLKLIRLKKPKRKRRSKSLKLKRPQRKIKGKKMKEGRRRKMRRQDLWWL